MSNLICSYIGSHKKFHMSLPDMWMLGVTLHFLEKLKLHTSVGANKPLKSS